MPAPSGRRWGNGELLTRIGKVRRSPVACDQKIRPVRRSTVRNGSSVFHSEVYCSAGG